VNDKLLQLLLADVSSQRALLVLITGVRALHPSTAWIQNAARHLPHLQAGHRWLRSSGRTKELSTHFKWRTQKPGTLMASAERPGPETAQLDTCKPICIFFCHKHTAIVRLASVCEPCRWDENQAAGMRQDRSEPSAVNCSLCAVGQVTHPLWGCELICE
jgi:hypothetical protein